MSLFHLALTYLGSLATFLVIDLIWLGVIAKNFYRTQLKGIITDAVNWPIALLFYALFIFGVIYFAIIPGVEAKSLQKTLLNAALFGFFTYATYELTNAATIITWPKQLIVVDILWGVVLTTSVAFIGYKILQALS